MITMIKEAYGVKILPEHITRFKEILSAHPLIEQIFRKDWIQSSIVDWFENWYRIHPLFLKILLDENFDKKLEVLRNSYGKFKSLINQIKTDRVNFSNIISNIDIFYEYKLKHDQVSFQPKIPENNRECDIMVIIEGTKYWGEIFTINCSKEEEIHNKIENDIRIQFNEKNKSNNYVVLNYLYYLDQEIIKNALLDFLLNETNKLTLTEGEELSKEFHWRNKVFCTVIFRAKGTKDQEGYGGSYTCKFINCSIRIKDKISDKLKKNQFPSGDAIKRFFVLKFDFGGTYITELNNAILGRVSYHPDWEGNQISRETNGLIHDLLWSSTLLKIDFIVIYWQNGKKEYEIINKENSPDIKFLKDNF